MSARHTYPPEALKWVKMPMPEWRDGQPGCKGCYDKDETWTILEIGMIVYLHKYLYYCLKCGNRLRRKRKGKS